MLDWHKIMRKHRRKGIDMSALFHWCWAAHKDSKIVRSEARQMEEKNKKPKFSVYQKVPGRGISHSQCHGDVPDVDARIHALKPSLRIGRNRSSSTHIITGDTTLPRCDKMQARRQIWKKLNTFIKEISRNTDLYTKPAIAVQYTYQLEKAAINMEWTEWDNSDTKNVYFEWSVYLYRVVKPEDSIFGSRE